MGRAPERIYFRGLDAERQNMVMQYRAVAGAYNSLWGAIYARTDDKPWKEDGIGQCTVSKDMASTGVTEPELITLRDIRNRTVPDSPMDRCPYHRIGCGCVLGDLMSPLCLDATPVALKEEIADKFGICLLPLENVFDTIQLGGRKPDDIAEDEINPLNSMSNSNLVQATIRGLQTVTAHIKSFPVTTE